MLNPPAITCGWCGTGEIYAHQVDEVVPVDGS
jgi:hypothetical protein